MPAENEVRGQCLCGAVSVAATLKSRSVGACHCSMCRRWGGGPMFALECGDTVRLEGGEHVAIYASSDWAERGFCARCGTHLFYRLRDGSLYALPVGLFGDEGGEWVFDHQVFIDEKPTYYRFANQTHDMTGAEVFAQFGAAED